MIEEEKEQESSDKVEKMSEKPFSSYSKLREGKSKIKIKGASVSALGSGLGSAPGSGSSVRVCDFCGKQFNSGKALGGHRRHHIQAQRKKEEQQEKVSYTLRIKPKNLVIRDNNNLIKSNIGNLNSSSSRFFRCLVCDKDFPSEKSLCGHMRSHPDRDWRGVNPPFTPTNQAPASCSSSSEEFMKVQDHQNYNKSNNNGSSSSTSEESLSGPVVVSSSCSVSSWLKKDKRGRKSIGEAEAAQIAAQNLMYMYLYGNYHLHRLPPREPTPEEAALLPARKRKNNVMKNHVSGSSSSPAGKQILEAENWKEKLEGSHGNEECEAENNIWDMKLISLIKEKKFNKKMNKKMKFGPEMITSEVEPLMMRTLKQQEVKPSQSYVCDICNKSFPCFQAFGGHKSKHNREKNIAKSTKGKEVVELRGGGEAEEEDKVCINGALLSSAGLNGEEEEQEEEASLISSDERLAISCYDNENNSNEEEVEEARQQSGSKMRDIDLNVPYVLEHEATDI